MKITLKLIKENKSYKTLAEDEVVAHDQSEIAGRVYAFMYAVVILFFVYVLVMEIKRQFHVQFIPGFNNPLQDLYNDIMNDLNL